MYEHRLVRPLQRSLVCSFVRYSFSNLASIHANTNIKKQVYMCMCMCVFVRARFFVLWCGDDHDGRTSFVRIQIYG